MKMKWDNNGIKTPLARARGMGAAKSGTHHWMAQRITAIANIPLMLWLVVSIVNLKGASYGEFTDWLAQPINAVLMILLVISGFYHAMLGSQVVTEDYIHNEGFKMFKIIGQKMFFFAAAVACIFAILKVAFAV